jgi:nitrate reductase gamma subunit
MVPVEDAGMPAEMSVDSAMDSLAFAQGPGLHWAIVIMTFGICWRISMFALARPQRDIYWARKEFRLRRGQWQPESYVMHAGLLVVLLGFAPHILLVRTLTGIGWPGLPIGLVWFAGAISLAAMVAVVIHRASETPPRGLYQQFDEYFSWLVVFASIVTGLVAFPHLGGGYLTAPYAAFLTAHLLSAELLMIWLPFGRLAHLALMPLLRGVTVLLEVGVGKVFN